MSHVQSVVYYQYFQYLQLFVVPASRYTIVELIAKPSLKKSLGVVYFQTENHRKVFIKVSKGFQPTNLPTSQHKNLPTYLSTY